MIALRKYGVASVIYFPLIKRSVVDFAVGADFTPVAGDTKLSKDGGAAASATTTPFAVTMGNGAMWGLTLNAADLQCAKLVVTIIDASTKAVEDQLLLIDTYGNASAEHAVDLDDSVRAGLTALPNAAAEASGGLYTRGSGAGQINQNANGQVDTRVVSMSSGVVTAAAIATDAIDADALAADALAEIKATTVAALNTDTYAELSSLPGASPTIKQAIMFMYMMARNKMTTTSTQRKLFLDDGSTVLGTWAVSDDGTTFTQGEVA